MTPMAEDRTPSCRGPRGVATVEPVPHGHTARRLDWVLLPPMLRRLVESRLGTPVVRTRSAGAGYTPGCASVLTGADGRRIFLKAASRKAQRPFADAYAEEIRNLRALPSGIAVPGLLWSHEDDLWVVLALEYVAGTNPVRPWTTAQLDQCLDTLEALADQLTPPPMSLRSFAEEFVGEPACWDHVRRTAPGWPHLEEAAALAGRFAQASAGRTLVHTDARDDNFLLTDAGAYLCDWNFPVVGAAWLDTVFLLMTACGDGVDADQVLARRRLTRDVDPGDVDAVLALLCGYFLERRDQPVPHTSPFLRRHQDWCAEASWAWLAQRRGWT
jgi:aminoglycoside phosphotransferase (APT) family kinase protein